MKANHPMQTMHKLPRITFIALFTLLSAISTSIHASESSGNQKNEKLVTTFYQQLFGDKDLTAIDRYVSKDYIQHNPSLADGRQALKDAASVWFKDAPKEKVDIRRVASNGDTVFLHIREVAPDGTVLAIVDIFRVKHGKIVEHWDVIQDVPSKSANAHPMF